MAMFQANPSRPLSSDQMPETVIGAMVRITGTLTSDGDVRIDGTLEQGEIIAKGAVIVGAQGVVKANIKAATCEIAGRVEGNIEAGDGIEISGTGTVQGEINSGGRFVIERGGVFIGRSTMSERSASAKNDIDAELEKDLAGAA